MTDYIRLVGTEEVRHAANTMSEAADTIRRAVGDLDDALRQHRQFMTEWLAQFEAALQASREAK
jgi:hypothetical protein